MAEKWRPVIGYEGFYEVSNLGHVRNCRIKRYGPKGDYLRPQMAGNLHYHIVNLCANGHSRVYLIHRLVAAAFWGPCPIGLEVNHKDGNKLNNRLDNLEYVTRKRNHEHAAELGLTLKGERNPLAKLTEKQVEYIRQSNRTQRDLAQEFSVDQSAIHSARTGRTWGHVAVPSRHDGLPHGEKHHNAKLTEDMVRFIRSTSESAYSIGRRWGLDDETIRCVRIGKTWRHLL